MGSDKGNRKFPTRAQGQISSAERPNDALSGSDGALTQREEVHPEEHRTRLEVDLP